MSQQTESQDKIFPHHIRNKQSITSSHVYRILIRSMSEYDGMVYASAKLTVMNRVNVTPWLSNLPSELFVLHLPSVFYAKVKKGHSKIRCEQLMTNLLHHLRVSSLASAFLILLIPYSQKHSQCLDYAKKTLQLMY